MGKCATPSRRLAAWARSMRALATGRSPAGAVVADESLRGASGICAACLSPLLQLCRPSCTTRCAPGDCPTWLHVMRERLAMSLRSGGWSSSGGDLRDGVVHRDLPIPTHTDSSRKAYGALHWTRRALSVRCPQDHHPRRASAKTDSGNRASAENPWKDVSPFF